VAGKREFSCRSHGRRLKESSVPECFLKQRRQAHSYRAVSGRGCGISGAGLFLPLDTKEPGFRRASGVQNKASENVFIGFIARERDQSGRAPFLFRRAK
jgi:hypothetical protein